MQLTYYLLAVAALLALAWGAWALAHGAWLQASMMGAVGLYLALHAIGVRWKRVDPSRQRPPALEAAIWMSAGLALLLIIINLIFSRG